ncbi:MAG: hypothetical protein IKF19_00325 [Bacilli bacterium]|nr:hypothetical protein [Bacilli bacterium]
MNKELLVNEINSIKEVISNMPQTTKKNKQKYLAYIKEKLDIYQKKEQELIEEIKKRCDEISQKEKTDNTDYNKIEEEKKIIFNKLLVLNEYNSPYEKIGLDKIIYNINHYYEENLETLNEDIKQALNCFKKAGISLSSEDFWYSKYLKEYMKVYLTEKEDSKVKQKLDEIYWKSPNIINEIAISIIDLYNKNEKNFKTYLIHEKDKILKDIKYQELVNKYNNLLKTISEKEFFLDTLSPKFISGIENIKDFEPDKYEAYINTLSNSKIDTETLEKLSSSLYEYKIYKEYKFIIDKFIEIYKEKDKFKNIYKTLIKDIKKQEKKIKKINKQIKVQEKWFKKQEKIEMLEVSLKNEITILKEKYQDIDITRINEIISTLNNNTTYYDAFKIISSNYTYLRKILTEENSEITDKDIDDKQKFLQEFLLSNKLTILDNITILNETSIANIISNRYKLLNLKLEGDDIENNFDSIIETLRKIKIINVINNSDVKASDIEFQIEAEKITNTEKK